MSHTVTAKLNKPARRFDNQNGSTFFVSLGEKNYDFKGQSTKWTNYDAALFAKDKQIDFYERVLIEGAILTVSGSGIIVDDSNKEYAPKLMLQDAKLEFISDGQASAPAPSQQQGSQTGNPAPAQQGSTSSALDDGGFEDIPF